MPYSSSDVYSGTRDPSFLITDNYTFHGKYIFQAMIEDLIENTWITSADKVTNFVEESFILNLQNHLSTRILDVLGESK